MANYLSEKLIILSIYTDEYIDAIAAKVKLKKY
jgi:hypothetical protein